ncbi:O-antigen polysaccharide polymerase Wzy [Geodermatophilus sp. SYSU D00815]
MDEPAAVHAASQVPVHGPGARLTRDSNSSWLSHRVLALILTAALVALWLLRQWLVAQDLQIVSQVALAAALLACFAVGRATSGRFWSMSTLFLLVASVFHVGLLVFPALGRPGVFVYNADSTWFQSTTTRTAAILVALSLLALALGAVVASSRQAHAATVQMPTERAGFQEAVVEVMGPAGFALTSIAVVAWLWLGYTALGPLFPLSSYQKWLEATSGLPIQYVYFGISLGVVLAAAAGDGIWWKRTLIPFGLFAGLALPLGLRGEVLFAAVAAAALVAAWRRMPRGVVVLALVVGLLTSVSVIKQVRQSGLGELGALEWSAAPVSGLAELGYTLRTVSVVAKWHEVANEPLLQGTTYFAPVERAVNSRLLSRPVPSAESDHRLMNVMMMNREGPIGGSFIAEAVHNFGWSGAVLVPLAIGLVLGFCDRRRPSVVVSALLGIVFVALLQHVRNSFTPVPAMLGAGVAAVALIAAAAYVRHRTDIKVHRIRGGVG